MKKYLILVLSVLAFVFVLTGCGKREQVKYTIALITDIGDIDDKSFNQGSWEGVVAYAADKNIAHKYYRPSEQSTDAYVASIDLAVDNGAKIIVTPGFLFMDPINIAQKKYPDVKFIILDASPEWADGGSIESNTHAILYAEQEAGYLAGYAIVKDGYRKLAYMGGMAVPAVVNFGYGFIRGADDAAIELDVTLELKYHYTGGFEANPAVQATAATLYNGGTEIIFACGGSLGQSVMRAAETANKKVIGVDVDQSADSDTVVTSAMKSLTLSVKNALAAYFGNNWDEIGGTTAFLAAAEDGIGLPYDTSRFATFTKAQYTAIFNKLIDGTVVVNEDISKAVTEITVTKTTISVVG